MPRIRTVKPEFFAHEQLNDLEEAHPRLRPMLVFEGLWGHCDKEGRFEWRPRTLKRNILPFVTFDINETLELLRVHGFIAQYEAGGKLYGYIPTFKEHQRITGSEAYDPPKYPQPPVDKPTIPQSDVSTGAVEEKPGNTGEILTTDKGNTEETPKKTGKEGKGREKERKGKDARAREVAATPLPAWLPATAWHDYVEHRKAKRSTLTARAAELAIEKLDKLRRIGFDPVEVIKQSIANGWTGLFAIRDPGGFANKQKQLEAENRRVLDGWVPPEMREKADAS